MRTSIQVKIFAVYLLALLLMILSQTVTAQVTAIHFNAGFNSANDVEWFGKLGDCDKQILSIDNNDNQKKYGIAVVPTIIIFDDGEEVKRFQADLSFRMVATRKEIQNYIDELIISKF